MGIFSKIKGLVSKTKSDNFLEELVDVKSEESIIEEEPIELPEGQIASFGDGVLDTDSKRTTEILKHNLEILIKRAKERGKIDKFMIIREDDFFPTDWEWRVLSSSTNLEKVGIPLSHELKRVYALEQKGIKPYTDIMGVKVPNASPEETRQAISEVDKTLGFVSLPSRFRSTKHFTINTPLGVTGNYNSVSTDRDYIIIDNINAFLESEYAYSVAYHDAYLDVSHESLPISTEAVVLIKDENYDRIMSDEQVAKELSKRRIIRFKGDEVIAIDMVLTEMGVLPSTIGTRYAHYDREILDILDKSIRELAERNGLFFDKSHAGMLTPEGGHFSNYYDDVNRDYQEAVQDFYNFLRTKFPEYETLFMDEPRIIEKHSEDIVQQIGTTRLLDAINEYNALAKTKIEETLTNYKKDRESITPEIHRHFVETITLINEFYKINNGAGVPELQSAIQLFLQGKSVQEQLNAAQIIHTLIKQNTLQVTTDDMTITPQKAFSSLFRDTVASKAVESENIEKSLEYERTQEQIK